MKHSIFLILLFIQVSGFSQSQMTQRPMIWVKPSDKAVILEKIAKNQWAKDYFDAFKKRVAKDVENHTADPKIYLSKIPFAEAINGKIPPLKLLKGSGGPTADERQAMMRYLQTGIDCGILYFLTDDTKYAQLSADVLHTVISGLEPLEINANGRNGGGLLYPDDHLREAREIGAQVPILYDFAYSFLKKGGMVYNVATGKRESFSFENAEKVFKKYIKMALEHGIIDCNWPILESSSLVGNTLALENENERKENLEYYLTKNTPHQDALLKVANFYKKYNGKWPESTNYAEAVAGISTYLMTLVTKYDPSLHLGNTYPQIPLALTTNYYLTYPNKHDMVIFGDGHRNYHAAYEEFEIAYYLGTLENSDVLKKEFGALLNSGINDKSYTRGQLGERRFSAEAYTEPLELLWFTPTIDGELKDYPMPTTDELPFAGMVLQRNPSTTGDAKDAFMAFVGGGSHVHGHASGMNMELYGRGFVLGEKGGRSAYTTDIHENYYRLFASHNTVVVNGASETDGGWVNLGTNTVQKVALEPQVLAKPISPNYSFTTTSFIDDKGDKAEATQERTLGIVRTSPKTGFYIDVFKSKSSLPNQFHDYIYHNIGESLDFDVKNTNFQLRPDTARYQASAKKEWVNNRKHRHPGWHFFKNVETVENYSLPISPVFSASKLQKTPVKMRLFINGNDNRDYTRVIAPPSTEAPKAYEKKETPTLIIRQKGDAWTNPFAVVYEPFEGNNDKGTVQSVEQILENKVFKGLKIKSIVEGKNITQYAFILESPDAVYEDKKLGISFKGRYAILTFDDKENLQSVYMGEGKSLSYKKVKITSNNDKSGAAFIDLNGNKPVVNNDKNLDVKY
jgi:Heparinase II/III-like protein